MRLETWSIERIKPYEQNPRLNAEAVDAVARSLHEFGFRQPLVVDEQETIIVGHTRWKAALQLGIKKVPVHVARDLSPAQIKAYRIADNQTGNIATWDYELLPLELAVRAVQFSSRSGEHVLDLFGGSGSTLIAAQQMGRKAFLMELDPLYCDVIVQRWEQFTGNKAERVGGGEEVAA